MANVLSVIEKKRQQAFKAMTKEAQTLATELDGFVAKEATGKVITAYKIGTALAAAQDAPDTYGNSVIEQMADYLSYADNPRTLYDCIRFSKAYSIDYVREQSARLMTSGGTLTVTHWFALSQIEDKEIQGKLLEKTLNKSLTTRDLYAEVSSARTTARSPRGPGRRPAIPSSPVIGLNRFYKMSGKLFNMREMFDKAVLSPIDELETSQVSDTLLEKMKLTHDRGGELKDMLDDVVTKLGDDIVTVTQKLAAAASEVPTNGEAPATDEKSSGKKGRRKKAKRGKKQAAVAADE